jgi:hypothetical protein
MRGKVVLSCVMFLGSALGFGFGIAFSTESGAFLPGHASAESPKEQAVKRLQLKHYNIQLKKNDLGLPITDGKKNEMVVLASQKLENIKPGETLLVAADCLFESRVKTNVMVDTRIVLTDAEDATEGVAIAEITGINIVNRPEPSGVFMHYWAPSRVGSISLDNEAKAKYVNFVAWSACDAPGVAGQERIIVHWRNGRLSVLRFANE